MQLHQLRYLLIIFAVLIDVGCGSKPVRVPTEYYDWQPKLGIFHLKFPAGWKYDGDNGHGNQWAEFSSRGCLITLDTDLASSLAGDAMGGNKPLSGELKGDARKAAEAMAPVSIIHQMRVDKGRETYGSYQEGEMEVFDSGFGSSRKSEFTATAGLASVQGYRATVLAMDRGIIVFCYCPRSDWPNLKPVFDEVLKSIHPGH